MDLIVYTSDSTISISNVVRYEVKNETENIETVKSEKKKRKKKITNSSEQISMESLMEPDKPEENLFTEEELKEIDPSFKPIFNNSDKVEDVFVPDTSRTTWIADAERVWEYEWPAYGCCPLRRRKLKTVLTDNEMVKVDDI